MNVFYKRNNELFIRGRGFVVRKSDDFKSCTRVIVKSKREVPCPSLLAAVPFLTLARLQTL